MLRRLFIVLLAVGGSCWFAAAPANAAAAGTRACGTIANIGEFGPQLLDVTAVNYDCKGALLYMENMGIAVHQDWDCHSAGVEAQCTLDDAVLSYGPAPSKSCGDLSFAANSDNLASGIVASRVSCKTAKAVARGSKKYGPTSAKTYRAAGFRCVPKTLQSELPATLYTCRKGRSGVAFQRN